MNGTDEECRRALLLAAAISLGIAAGLSALIRQVPDRFGEPLNDVGADLDTEDCMSEKDAMSTHGGEEEWAECGLHHQTRVLVEKP